MKILLYGATGNIGQRILNEALQRGHEVYAVQRKAADNIAGKPGLQITQGDLADKAQLEQLLQGIDVVVSAIAPVELDHFKQANINLIDVLQQHPNIRAIIVGGAASTEISPGVRLVDSPVFDTLPDEWKPAIHAHVAVLDLYKKSNINWTYFSPASHIQAGERTGKFRLGKTSMIFDEKGESRISYEDYAVALVDEIEQNKHPRQQFCIGY